MIATIKPHGKEASVAIKDIIIMSKEEIKRLHYVRNAEEGKIKQVEAAKDLDISDRQFRRLVFKYRTVGEEGLVHGLRGTRSNRRKAESLKEKILKLYEKKYYGFGPTLLSEKLFELEGIEISDEWLRQLLMSERGVENGWQRKGRKHRRWRERKESCGTMVQMDGSIHDWFEGRGPECVLMGYIDDATGRVYGRFYEYEGTFPAMDSFRHYIRKHGIPCSLYLDKHGAYQSKKKLTAEEELEGKEKPETQFERAVKELGVKVIPANSPQAKGRIERLFNTFQDRVIKEMRLAGVSSIEEANKFLEGYLTEYNKRFSVVARNTADLHRKVPKGINLDRIFCIKTKHPIRNDFTVIHEKKLYQIEDKTRSKHIVVEERMNGSIKLYAGDSSLKYKQIENLPVRKIEVKNKVEIKLKSLTKKQYDPKRDNPFYRFRLKGSTPFNTAGSYAQS
jgi:hypothetical protein